MDGRGRPLAGWEAVLAPTGRPLGLTPDSPVRRSRTDDRGRFELTGIPAGEWDLLLLDDQARWRRVRVAPQSPLHLLPGERRRLFVRLELGTGVDVDGLVAVRPPFDDAVRYVELLDLAGHPIAMAIQSCDWDTVERHERDGKLDPGYRPHYPRDFDPRSGRFRFHDVPPGRYVLRVRDTGRGRLLLRMPDGQGRLFGTPVWIDREVVVGPRDTVLDPWILEQADLWKSTHPDIPTDELEKALERLVGRSR